MNFSADCYTGYYAVQAIIIIICMDTIIRVNIFEAFYATYYCKMQ
jgi:hypothetical protein